MRFHASLLWLRSSFAGSRILLTSFTKTESFKWAALTIGLTLLLLLLGCCTAFACIISRKRKSDQVNSEEELMKV